MEFHPAELTAICLRGDRLLLEETAQTLSCSYLQDRVVVCTFQLNMVA